MMLADNGALATAGAIAGILGVVSAAFVGLWAQRFAVKSRQKDAADKQKVLDDIAARHSQDTQLSTTQFGLTVIERAVTVTEAQNKELRVDLIAAEARIDQLQTDLRASQKECAELRKEIRENEAECKRRLSALAKEIEKLRGSHE